MQTHVAPLKNVTSVAKHILCGSVCAAMLLALTASAQSPLAIYTDGLVNGFDDWSWAAHNMANTNPVHAGTKSISVSAAANNYEAISFHHADFSTSLYTNFSFWANGGTNGGQLIQVYAELSAVGQPAYQISPALVANTWQQYTIPLSTLGVANKSNLSRINIQLRPGPNGTFYVDDVQLGANPVPSLVNISVNATQTVRTADSRHFGLNLTMWDTYFDPPNHTPFHCCKRWVAPLSECPAARSRMNIIGDPTPP